MLDTHAHIGGCKKSELTKKQRMPSFAEFSSHFNLNEDQQDRFNQKARSLIGNIIELANPYIAHHPVNKGITESNAACFSFLRADLAVAHNGEPALYEINEFPFAVEK